MKIFKQMIFVSSIAVFLVFLSFDATAYSKEISVNHFLKASIDDELWLSRFTSGGGENILFALGFSDKTVNLSYSIYKIVGKSISKTVDLPFTTEAIPNPYVHIEDIKIFTLIGKLLFVGIKKINGDTYVAVIDIQHQPKLRTSIKFQSRPESSLLLDDTGNFYLAGTSSDGSISLLKITEANQANIQKTENSPSGQKITAALYHNNFIFLALSDVSPKFVKTTMSQLDINGTVLNKTSIDGVVFQILPASPNSLLGIRSLGLESKESDALLYSTDLSQVNSYKIPHFYELIGYPGSIVALHDGSLLFFKKNLNSSSKESIEILRYASGTQPVQVAQINENEKQAKIINLMNEKTNQKLTVMTLELIPKQEKIEKFCNVYHVDISDLEP
jgi:hypothetical protein